MVRAGWAKGLRTSVLAFDLAQFFPSLNHEVLVIILRKLGFLPLVVKFFSLSGRKEDAVCVELLSVRPFASRCGRG
ncbi:hypothetical protein BDZ97DRAFT_1853672, partial [Flammula alnicola]